MPTRLSVTHTTRYLYEPPAGNILQQVRLMPVNDPLQSVVEWSLDIKGGEKQVDYLDCFGNRTLLIRSQDTVSEIELTATGVVDVEDRDGILGKTYGDAPLWVFQQTTERTVAGREIRKLAKQISKSDNALLALHDLSRQIASLAPYKIGETDSEFTAEEALQAGAGVCQDHAQIFISASREAGLPARYVSGYLLMNDRIDQEASHAWAEVHLDDLGWVGFDVSNGICPDDRYVRLAIGRDSRDAAPVRGVRYGASDESMIVSVQVQQ